MAEKDDTVDIMEFIRRFEASPEAMNLVDQLEKCNIFSSYLRFQELLLQIKTVNYLVVSDTRKRLADQTVRTVHWWVLTRFPNVRRILHNLMQLDQFCQLNQDLHHRREAARLDMFVRLWQQPTNNCNVNNSNIYFFTLSIIVKIEIFYSY